MKRRMRPVADAVDQRMLDGIDVAVLDVTSIVRLVPDQVLPKSTLPYPTFPASMLHARQSLELGYRTRKPRFDQSPANRKVSIACRQRPHSMQVVRQHNEG